MEGKPSRSDTALSLSVGAIWAPAPTHSVAINLARSTKLPNAEELFSNGPDLATGTFEIGNPDLEAETSLGLDLRFRVDHDTWGLELVGSNLTDEVARVPTSQLKDVLVLPGRNVTLNYRLSF